MRSGGWSAASWAAMAVMFDVTIDRRFLVLGGSYLVRMPFAIAFPRNRFTGAVYAALVLVVVRALGLLTRRKIKGAVTSLIAGICLLDACFAANQGCDTLAIIAIVAFGLTTVFQRVVPGT